MFKITISGIPADDIKNVKAGIQREYSEVIRSISIAADIITIIVGTKEIAEAIINYIKKRKKEPKLRTVTVTLNSIFKISDNVARAAH